MELCPESLLESASNLVFELLLLVVLLLLSLVGVAEEDVEELDAVGKRAKKLIGVVIDPALSYLFTRGYTTYSNNISLNLTYF